MNKPFCDAISNLLNFSKNQEELGNRHVINALRNALKEQDRELYKSLTKSFYDLSFIPSNCIILHDLGISSVKEKFHL